MATYFGGHLLTGVHGSRPAANAVPAGALYSCTTHALIYQSDGATWATYATLGAGGDALTSGHLGQFAATTSAQLRTVLSDETGTGAAVFADAPTFTGTPLVPDDAYDATTWNANLGVPTKNAIRDKIESLAGASVPTWVSTHPDSQTHTLDFVNGGSIGGTVLGSPATAPAITHDRLVVTGGVLATADLKANVWTPPATPYVVTAKIRQQVGAVFGHAVNFVIRSSAGGVIRTIEIFNNSASHRDRFVQIVRYTALTTITTTDYSSTWDNPWCYARYSNDGSTHKFFLSEDGREDNYVQIFSEAVGAGFFAANTIDQYGVGVDSRTTVSAGVNLCEWIDVT
jgi:hypothetical protein